MLRPSILVVPALLTCVWSLPARAGDHPPLVSAQAARCTLCHGDLIEGRAAVHPPAAEDCTNCHDVTVGEEGTTITLMEAEPALCVICHDDKAAAADGELATPHFPVVDSCLTCHDPHAGTAKPALVEAVPALCADCHDLEELQEKHGAQLTQATDCTACHEPHGSPNPKMLRASHLHPPFEMGSCEACHRQPFGDRVRLRARGNALCEACHGEFEAPGGDGSVHPALQGERGRAGCLSCHDPHMSDRPRMLKASGPDLCAQCHGSVVAAARAETGHYPAGDDCLTCHRPHTSEEPHLLDLRPPELCAQCHDVEGEELTKAHLGADLTELQCTACHTPHGSGNPKLLAANVHPPVLDGCDTCHEGSYDQLLEDGESALCLLCHDEIGEEAEKAQFPHGALELGPCTECHNPHASAQDKLVKSPGAGPCVECHDDKAAGPGEVAHGVIDLVGCRACHEPHGGNRPKMLRATGAQLCLSCHDPAVVHRGEEGETVLLLGRFPVPAERVDRMATLRLSPDGERGHPVAGHRVVGTPTAREKRAVETTFEGELTCLSCHDPHKGKSSKLLRWGAASTLEACIHCHPK